MIISWSFLTQNQMILCFEKIFSLLLPVSTILPSHF